MKMCPLQNWLWNELPDSRKSELAHIKDLPNTIYITKGTVVITKCPYCGRTDMDDTLGFPIEHYEGGSGGIRTFRCPKCKGEMIE